MSQYPKTAAAVSALSPEEYRVNPAERDGASGHRCVTQQHGSGHLRRHRLG
jgi:hypothetical protein